MMSISLFRNLRVYALCSWRSELNRSLHPFFFFFLLPNSPPIIVMPPALRKRPPLPTSEDKPQRGHKKRIRVEKRGNSSSENEPEPELEPEPESEPKSFAIKRR